MRKKVITIFGRAQQVTSVENELRWDEGPGHSLDPIQVIAHFLFIPAFPYTTLSSQLYD